MFICFLFIWTRCCHVALADLKPAMLTRLALKLKGSACLCLPSAGAKAMSHHCARLVAIYKTRFHKVALGFKGPSRLCLEVLQSHGAGNVSLLIECLPGRQAVLGSVQHTTIKGSGHRASPGWSSLGSVPSRLHSRNKQQQRTEPASPTSARWPDTIHR